MGVACLGDLLSGFTLLEDRFADQASVSSALAAIGGPRLSARSARTIRAAGEGRNASQHQLGALGVWLRRY
jgi:hypothetical protein